MHSGGFLCTTKTSCFSGPVPQNKRGGRHVNLPETECRWKLYASPEGLQSLTAFTLHVYSGPERKIHVFHFGWHIPAHTHTHTYTWWGPSSCTARVSYYEKKIGNNWCGGCRCCSSGPLCVDGTWYPSVCNVSPKFSDFLQQTAHIGIFLIHILRLNTQLYHLWWMHFTFLHILVLASLIKLPGLEHKWILMRIKLRVSGSWSCRLRVPACPLRSRLCGPPWLYEPPPGVNTWCSPVPNVSHCHPKATSLRSIDADRFGYNWPTSDRADYKHLCYTPYSPRQSLWDKRVDFKMGGSRLLLCSQPSLYSIFWTRKENTKKEKIHKYASQARISILISFEPDLH